MRVELTLERNAYNKSRFGSTLERVVNKKSKLRLTLERKVSKNLKNLRADMRFQRTGY